MANDKSARASRLTYRAARGRAKSARPQLIKVCDNIYSAVNYARANVLYVITSESVVVIDTTESPAAARKTLDDFRKVCRLPIRYIIYTHFHGDHIRGAEALREPSTQVIAQRRLLEEVAKVELLLPYNRRLTKLQFGFSLLRKIRGESPTEGDPDPALSIAPAGKIRRAVFITPLTDNGYVPPDITFDEQYLFEEGGVAFELYHAPGETYDQLIVWLPREKALFCGDLFYYSFPMLSSPMKPDRPVLSWIKSLERLRSFRAEVLVPSHNVPIKGAKEVDTVLANYERAIRHVHDETVKYINDGLSLEEIRGKVRLPEDLAQLPYLQPTYGSVEWAVNGIFRQYTGWYNFNPADLKPNPRAILYKSLLEVCGGAAPLIKKARAALAGGQHQLALELTDIVLGVQPWHQPARILKSLALRRLGEAALNGVERNIYLAAAVEYASESESKS